MANQTQQLTVADLEAAKDSVRSAQDISMSDGDHRNYELYGIAATCIGIVEEMLECQWPNAEDPNEWFHDAGQNAVIDEKSGEDVFCNPNYMLDADHIVELHNLWLKAVAAFGGEVK